MDSAKQPLSMHVHTINTERNNNNNKTVLNTRQPSKISTIYTLFFVIYTHSARTHGIFTFVFMISVCDYLSLLLVWRRLLGGVLYDFFFLVSLDLIP